LDTRLDLLFQGSRYAERLLHRYPAWQSWLETALEHPVTETVATLLTLANSKLAANAGIDAPQHIDQTLRHCRQQAMLAIMGRDLTGLADFAEVVAAITNLADGVVSIAATVHRRALLSEWQIAATTESENASDLIIVGMGKLGGGELNVSSDIDLIFIHPHDGDATAERSWHQFHAQLGRRIIRTLDNVDADGFVFRVDMRLRPFGDSGPLVCSLASLQDYFVQHARPWERYAWLKARALTGSAFNQQQLMAMVTPFVFRRYHDYAAIDEMRSLHQQIRTEAAKRGKEDDIKVGRGGIREVEFVAQLHQLIRGGRAGEDSVLQTRATRTALTLLAQRAILPQAQVNALMAAYLFLRNLEHRLQYLDDQQTQSLPANDTDRARIAHAMGFANWGAFLGVLEQHRALVRASFEDVFGDIKKRETPISTVVSRQNIVETTVGIGLSQFNDESVRAETQRRLSAWQQSSRMQSLSPRLATRVQSLISESLNAAAAVDRSTATLFRLWDLIEAIDRREPYLALLQEYPDALKRAALIAHKSAWAADFLKRHPVLLDELTRAAATTTIDWAAERTALQRACDQANGDVEKLYEILRHTKQVLTLRLNIADIEGRIGVMALSDALSALADMLLDVTIVLVARVLANQTGATSLLDWTLPTHFAIIGYGKLGSKELGYASDLDLVFLYDDRHVASAEYYAKLAQRLNSWLNTMTAGGILYETDLRLRPDGAAGMLVSSLTAFAQYQTSRAWTWEHQALTRARWCAGDANLKSTFDQIRHSILATTRDHSALKQEIIDMRDKMRAEKKDRGDKLNLKHTKGGMVDIEFIMQYLILAYAHEHREFLDNLGNFALISRAGALGLIDEDVAASLAKAYLAYRERAHRARTNNETETWISKDELATERRAVISAWGAVFGLT
jgi:[glutamine synthetase] adenylyltransferase / [glutamine synthetase]-adenylyl-L-tyrosine phosphorylase